LFLRFLFLVATSLAGVDAWNRMFARLLTRRLAAASAPAGVAAFYVQTHKVFAEEKTDSPNETASQQGSLTVLQRIANFVSDNPFKTVAGTAVPMYLAIFAYESMSPATRDMPLSQRLIHTRVYGQVHARPSISAYLPVPAARSPTTRMLRAGHCHHGHYLRHDHRQRPDQARRAV
jgi:hypothetical protein